MQDTGLHCSCSVFPVNNSLCFLVTISSAITHATDRWGWTKRFLLSMLMGCAACWSFADGQPPCSFTLHRSTSLLKSSSPLPLGQHSLISSILHSKPCFLNHSLVSNLEGLCACKGRATLHQKNHQDFVNTHNRPTLFLSSYNSFSLSPSLSPTPFHSCFFFPADCF